MAEIAHTEKHSCFYKFTQLALFYSALSTMCATATLASAERYKIEGTVLYFDMGHRGADFEYPRELEKTDVSPIVAILLENPDIDTISVSGPGGYGPAADEIIEKILSLGLNTTAFGDCISACANIFLAGQSRTLMPGARLGFHRPFISKEDEFAYFKAHRGRMGWTEEFDYVPWIYDVGLSDMIKAFSYMASRGVTTDFIARAYSIDSFSIWYPSSEELVHGGVLNSSFVSTDEPSN